MADETNNAFEYEPLVVGIEDDDGTVHEFEELDAFAEGDVEFVALLPTNEYGGISDIEDGFIILRRYYEGEDVIVEEIEDEEEFARVGAIFEERLLEKFTFGEQDEDA